MLRRLKSFFTTEKRSLTDFEYYKEIVKAPFSFSLKYLFFLLFLSSLVGSLILASGIATLIPKIPTFTDKLKTASSNAYPPELIVSIKNQKLVTNEKEPYVIDIPKELSEQSSGHLITIDTKGSVDDYKKYNSIFLVTGDSIVAPDSQNSSKTLGSYKVYPLTESLSKEGDGVVLNKKVYDTILAKALPYLNYLQPGAIILLILIVLVLPFIITGFLLLLKLVYLLVFSLILWVIAKIMDKDLGYKNVYQIAIHGSTLIVVLDLVLNMFGINMPFLLPSLILFVFTILVLSKFKSIKA